MRTRRLDQPERDLSSSAALPQPIPEAALYPVVAKWLAGQGFLCWRDVSFLGRWIDVYAIHQETGETVAVELKVTDWKRGLRQALQARSAAHRTYLAMWAPFVHRAMTESALTALSSNGIGLLSVNGKCEVRRECQPRQASFGRYVLLPSGRPSHFPR